MFKHNKLFINQWCLLTMPLRPPAFRESPFSQHVIAIISFTPLSSRAKWEAIATNGVEVSRGLSAEHHSTRFPFGSEGLRASNGMVFNKIPRRQACHKRPVQSRVEGSSRENNRVDGMIFACPLRAVKQGRRSETIVGGLVC